MDDPESLEDVYQDEEGMSYILYCKVAKKNFTDFGFQNSRGQQVNVIVSKEDDAAYPLYMVKYK